MFSSGFLLVEYRNLLTFDSIYDTIKWKLIDFTKLSSA